MLGGLNMCKLCRLGPKIPLSMENVIGELKNGFGGYLYVYVVVTLHVNCTQMIEVPRLSLVVQHFGIEAIK